MLQHYYIIIVVIINDNCLTLLNELQLIFLVNQYIKCLIIDRNKTGEAGRNTFDIYFFLKHTSIISIDIYHESIQLIDWLFQCK